MTLQEHLSHKNSMVLNNAHIFKKYFKNIEELAIESEIRIAEGAF